MPLPKFGSGSTGLAVGFAVVAAIVVIALMVVGGWISTLDQEATLGQQVSAQQGVVEDQADSTWKVVKQNAQVQDRYHDDFKSAYADIMSARYSGKGDDPLLNFIMESNPQYDSSLYKQLMASIEGQRRELVEKERLLRDLDSKHDLMFDKVISGFVLRVAGRERTEIKVITSDRTRDMLENGENDVDVYGE